MNDTELNAVLDLIHADLRGSPAPSSLHERVHTIPFMTPQEHGRSPQLDPGWFSMFSAVKLIAAGVIVALFGGFLLAGVLTTPQEGEVLPAAVTDSHEPEVATAPTEPTEAPDPSVRTDILPSVALTVEEVERGVFRVIDDGVRDLAKANNLDIVAGHDDGIWLLRPQRYFRLGDDAWRAWPTEKAEGIVLEVAPDGRVWAIVDHGDRAHLYSVGRDGDDWTRTKGAMGDTPEHIWVTSDGTVWAEWEADPEDPGSPVIGYLGADGWEAVGEHPSDWVGGFLVSDHGDVWAMEMGARRARDLYHFVDGTWRTYDGFSGSRHDGRLIRWRPADTAVGPDGTLWHTGGALHRFDGTEWMTFGPPEWMPIHLEGVEDGWGELHVAADGSLWVSARLREQWWGVDSRPGYDRPICDHGIDGVARFDGVTWSRFLQGHCVESMDIAADGSVWLLASESGAWSGARTDHPLIQTDTYVITPEAVAADE